MTDQMEIQSVKFKESGWLLNDELSVPNNPGNRHAAAILEWIAQGNTPEPADIVVVGYEERRRQEYPSTGDQLDVLWKQFNQMLLAGTDLIQEADDMLGAIQAVKARHPKPE